MLFFSVSSQEGVEPRSIYQFHYTGWPDHGVPDDPSSVLNILEDVNIKQDHTEGAGPIVVHCRCEMIEARVAASVTVLYIICHTFRVSSAKALQFFLFIIY